MSIHEQIALERRVHDILKHWVAPATISELAEATGATKSRTRTALRRLRREGHVESCGLTGPRNAECFRLVRR